MDSWSGGSGLPDEVFLWGAGIVSLVGQPVSGPIGQEIKDGRPGIGGFGGIPGRRSVRQLPGVVAGALGELRRPTDVIWSRCSGYLAVAQCELVARC